MKPLTAEWVSKAEGESVTRSDVQYARALCDSVRANLR